MTKPTPPLSDAEFEQLEELLVSDDVPADCMNIEMLDGYLAAVVAAPAPIPLSVWLPPVWTADGDEAGFGSGAVVQKVIELVLRYYNELLGTIGEAEADGDEDGEPAWQPFCYAPGDGDEDPDIGEEWLAGFLQGMELWPDDWDKTMEDPSIAEELLVEIVGEEDEDIFAGTQEDQLLRLEQAGEAVHRLFLHWRALGLEAPDAVEVDVPAALAKSGPGRNEPCPCGSGKKFKKCCGADN
ncbi:MAG: UPF0149 family protein [Zoogloea sp.]|nr:UPF0149 family protein [Zoogloea sp.]